MRSPAPPPPHGDSGSLGRRGEEGSPRGPSPSVGLRKGAESRGAGMQDGADLGAGLQCPKALGWSGGSWKGQVWGEGTWTAGAL